MDNTNYVEVMIYHRDDVIFREGDKGECAYAVEKGEVGIFANYGEPDVRLLTKLGPGTVFGEMGMVRGFPRSATAVALEPETGVCAITWEKLASYFRESPAKIVQIMQQMGNRIADLENDYLGACEAVVELVAENKRVTEENKALQAELDRRSSQAAREPGPPVPAEPKDQHNVESKYKTYINGYTARKQSRFARR